jgi:hypothetical protein
MEVIIFANGGGKVAALERRERADRAWCYAQLGEQWAGLS